MPVAAGGRRGPPPPGARAARGCAPGLVIESGEPRDIHHMATLIGYGAAAINPYVMFESLDELADRSLLPEDLERDEAEKRIVKAIGKGLMKTISKMGISTIQSYCGAQIFEAVGLEPRADRQALHRAPRRGSAASALERARDRGDRAPLPRLPADRARPAAGRRRAPVAARRRAARLEPRHDRQRSSTPCGERRPNGDCAIRADLRRSSRAWPTRRRRAARLLRGLMRLRSAEAADPARRGRAGDRDRQAVHDRRDEPRRARRARPTRRWRSR